MNIIRDPKINVELNMIQLYEKSKFNYQNI